VPVIACFFPGIRGQQKDCSTNLILKTQMCTRPRQSRLGRMEARRISFGREIFEFPRQSLAYIRVMRDDQSTVHQPSKAPPPSGDFAFGSLRSTCDCTLVGLHKTPPLENEGTQSSPKARNSVDITAPFLGRENNNRGNRLRIQG